MKRYRGIFENLMSGQGMYICYEVPYILSDQDYQKSMPKLVR